MSSLTKDMFYITPDDSQIHKEALKSRQLTDGKLETSLSEITNRINVGVVNNDGDTDT